MFVAPENINIQCFPSCLQPSFFFVIIAFLLIILCTQKHYFFTFFSGTFMVMVVAPENITHTLFSLLPFVPEFNTTCFTAVELDIMSRSHCTHPTGGLPVSLKHKTQQVCTVGGLRIPRVCGVGALSVPEVSESRQLECTTTVRGRRLQCTTSVQSSRLECTTSIRSRRLECTTCVE